MNGGGVRGPTKRYGKFWVLIQRSREKPDGLLMLKYEKVGKRSVGNLQI